MKEHTLKHLHNRILLFDSYPYTEITKENIAKWLCGENYKFADNPYSTEFLCNVAFNSGDSLAGVIYLQLSYNHL